MTMKRVLLTATSLAAAMVLLGCPLLKKKPAAEDAGAETEPDPTTLPDAATVAVTGTGAKNEANVLRYADEEAIANEPAVIGKDGVKVRNFPGNGPEVATLVKGTVVAKIAKRFSTAVLVMFDDPAGDGSKLLGWVSPTAFDVTAPPPAKTVVVPIRDASAPTPTVVVKDAGTAPVVDAGAPKDAGAPGKDAGSNALPAPPRGQNAVQAVDGKCPDNFKLLNGMCRRLCAADADCGRGVYCVNKLGAKHCSVEK